MQKMNKYTEHRRIESRKINGFDPTMIGCTVGLFCLWMVFITFHFAFSVINSISTVFAEHMTIPGLNGVTVTNASHLKTDSRQKFHFTHICMCGGGAFLLASIEGLGTQTNCRKIH